MFANIVLVAEINRASPKTPSGLLECMQARRVTGDGQTVEFTRREFDLLAALLRDPDRVHTRDALLEQVWGSAYLQPKTVDVHIAGLRRKLGDALKISSLRGVGYRLES